MLVPRQPENAQIFLRRGDCIARRSLVACGVSAPKGARHIQGWSTAEPLEEAVDVWPTNVTRLRRAASAKEAKFPVNSRSGPGHTPRGPDSPRLRLSVECRRRSGISRRTAVAAGLSR